MDADSEGDLGVIIAKDLDPHEQCDAARNGASKVLNMIGRRVECESAEIVAGMCNSCVGSMFENCI